MTWKIIIINHKKHEPILTGAIFSIPWIVPVKLLIYADGNRSAKVCLSVIQHLKMSLLFQLNPAEFNKNKFLSRLTCNLLLSSIIFRRMNTYVFVLSKKKTIIECFCFNYFLFHPFPKYESSPSILRPKYATINRTHHNRLDGNKQFMGPWPPR